MFDNIGGKIKTLATVIAVLGIIASILVGVVVMVLDIDSWGLALIVMVVGSLVSWIGSFLLYGFGELIYRVTAVEKKMLQISTSVLSGAPVNQQSKSDEDKIIF